MFAFCLEVVFSYGVKGRVGRTEKVEEGGFEISKLVIDEGEGGEGRVG